MGTPSGTAFRLEMPLSAERPVAVAEPVQPSTPASVEGADVLLIDDEASVRSLLQEVLQAMGHRVLTASSMESAVEKIAERRFDMVVSDIHLGDGSGVDVFKAWDSHTPYPRPCFLFLTGDIVSESLERMTREGGAMVLQKPVDLREFRLAVGRVYGGGKTEREMSNS